MALDTTAPGETNKKTSLQREVVYAIVSRLTRFRSYNKTRHQSR